MRFDGAFNQFTDSDDLEFSGHTPANAAARHAIDYSAPRSEQFDEEEEEDDTLPF
jgi:hypothetical protein